MTITTELDKFKAERDAGLKALDMNYATKMMPGATVDEVRLIAMHKARIEVTSMPEALKSESKQWLISRGYTLFFY